MAQVNLTNSELIDTTNDNIVIVEALEYIPGGRTLDVSGWPKDTVPAGHPVILDGGEYKPIAIDGGDAIVETKAAQVIGYLAGTVLTKDPRASIIVRGTVNPEAAVYAIPASCQAPVPLIRFAAE